MDFLTDDLISLIIFGAVCFVGLIIVCGIGALVDLVFGKRLAARRKRRDARPYRAKPDALRRDFLLACFWMEVGGVIILVTLFLFIHPTASFYHATDGVRTRDWALQWGVTVVGLVVGVFAAWYGWLNMEIWRGSRRRDRREMPARREREMKERRRA